MERPETTRNFSLLFQKLAIGWKNNVIINDGKSFTMVTFSETETKEVKSQNNGRRSLESKKRGRKSPYYFNVSKIKGFQIFTPLRVDFLT